MKKVAMTAGLLNPQSAIRAADKREWPWVQTHGPRIDNRSGPARAAQSPDRNRGLPPTAIHVAPHRGRRNSQSEIRN